MSVAKKAKTYHFHREWEDDYFFTFTNSKSVCLICNAAVAIPKKGNLERHFLTVHKKYANDFPARSALRTEKVSELKRQLAAKQAVFTRPVNKSKAATVASYRVSRVLAKRKKSFKDGGSFQGSFFGIR